ncbi:hypothetical protein [Nocardioides aurantiacus]|uniref:Uncharacterized protein n=1 Tax=Nocardioides aurantiacus TaxID=86796 RepID=A0A3N2CP72_9ACTN|nr:hypothetical protein [Nocardioides aurantiacus]ROR89327.1 hypothetical protein EDD33_0147 [Nocardioides aurantiacus]
MNDDITDPADTVDGDRLIAWAEPNTVALNDERVDTIVRATLATPIPDDLAMGVPLLLHADATVPPMPLMDAIVQDRRHNATVCDVCGDKRRSRSRLLIPCGESAVAVHFCWLCRALLDRPIARTSVVWD